MVLLNHRKNLAKKFQKGLKAMNRTKTANKINAHVEIQNQFVFIFTANEEEEEKNEAIKEIAKIKRDYLLKEIEKTERVINYYKCEVDNYNLHISKKTGEPFQYTTTWRSFTRLNLRDIEEAKKTVREKEKEIDNLENELKELRENLKEINKKFEKYF